MSTIKGVIESKDVTGGTKADGAEWKRAAYKIQGMTFSTFKDEIINKFDVGAAVECEYFTKDNYNNLTSMKEAILTGTEAASVVNNAPESYNDRKNKSIVRQCCVKAAAKLTIVDDKALEDPTQIASATIHVAEIFEAWVNRD